MRDGLWFLDVRALKLFNEDNIEVIGACDGKLKLLTQNEDKGLVVNVDASWLNQKAAYGLFIKDFKQPVQPLRCVTFKNPEEEEAVVDNNVAELVAVSLGLKELCNLIRSGSKREAIIRIDSIAALNWITYGVTSRRSDYNKFIASKVKEIEVLQKKNHLSIKFEHTHRFFNMPADFLATLGNESTFDYKKWSNKLPIGLRALALADLHSNLVGKVLNSNMKQTQNVKIVEHIYWDYHGASIIYGWIDGNLN